MLMDRWMRGFPPHVVLLFAIALIPPGCGKDGGSKLANGDPPDETPTYTTDVAPILQASCSCHLPGGPRYGLTPLDTYDSVYQRRERVKQRAGVAGTMPPTGPLPDSLRQTIIGWVDGGAPE